MAGGPSVASSSSLVEEGDLFCPVSFRCHCSTTSMGEQVCVLGSTSSLGKWSFSHRVGLSTSPETFPFWHTQRPVLLPAYSTIRYKFLICSRDAPLCKACRRPPPTAASADALSPSSSSSSLRVEDVQLPSLVLSRSVGEAEDEGRKPSLEGEEFRGCLVASRRCNSRQWKSQTGRGGLLLGGGRHGGYGRNKSNDGTCTGYGEEEEERYRGGGFRRDGGLNDPRGGEGAEEDDDLDEEGAAACSRRSAREGSVRMMKFPPFPSRVVLADEAMRTQIRCCGAVMKGELEAVKKWESIRGHQGDRILQLGNEPLQVFDTFGAEPGPLPPPVRRPSPPKRFARVLGSPRALPPFPPSAVSSSASSSSSSTSVSPLLIPSEVCGCSSWCPALSSRSGHGAPSSAPSLCRLHHNNHIIHQPPPPRPSSSSSFHPRQYYPRQSSPRELHQVKTAVYLSPTDQDAPCLSPESCGGGEEGGEGGRGGGGMRTRRSSTASSVCLCCGHSPPPFPPSSSCSMYPDPNTIHMMKKSSSLTPSPRKSFVRPLVVPPLNTAALLPCPESPRVSLLSRELEEQGTRERVVSVARREPTKGRGREGQEEGGEAKQTSLSFSCSWDTSSPFLSSRKKLHPRPPNSSRVLLPSVSSSTTSTAPLTSTKTTLPSSSRRGPRHCSPFERASLPPPSSPLLDLPSTPSTSRQRDLESSSPPLHSYPPCRSCHPSAFSTEPGIRKSPGGRGEERGGEGKGGGSRVVEYESLHSANDRTPPPGSSGLSACPQHLPQQAYPPLEASSCYPGSSPTREPCRRTGQGGGGGESGRERNLSAFSSPRPSFASSSLCSSSLSQPKPSSPLSSETFRAAVEAMTAYYPAHGLEELGKDSISLAGYSPRHRGLFKKRYPPPLTTERGLGSAEVCADDRDHDDADDDDAFPCGEKEEKARETLKSPAALPSSPVAREGRTCWTSAPFLLPPPRSGLEREDAERESSALSPPSSLRLLASGRSKKTEDSRVERPSGQGGKGGGGGERSSSLVCSWSRRYLLGEDEGSSFRAKGGEEEGEKEREESEEIKTGVALRRRRRKNSPVCDLSPSGSSGPKDGEKEGRDGGSREDDVADRKEESRGGKRLHEADGDNADDARGGLDTLLRALRRAMEEDREEGDGCLLSSFANKTELTSGAGGRGDKEELSVLVERILKRLKVVEAEAQHAAEGREERREEQEGATTPPIGMKASSQPSKTEGQAPCVGERETPRRERETRSAHHGKPPEEEESSSLAVSNSKEGPGRVQSSSSSVTPSGQIRRRSLSEEEEEEEKEEKDVLHVKTGTSAAEEHEEAGEGNSDRLRPHMERSSRANGPSSSTSARSEPLRVCEETSFFPSPERKKDSVDVPGKRDDDRTSPSLVPGPNRDRCRIRKKKKKRAPPTPHPTEEFLLKTSPVYSSCPGRERILRPTETADSPDTSAVATAAAAEALVFRLEQKLLQAYTRRSLGGGGEKGFFSSLSSSPRSLLALVGQRVESAGKLGALERRTSTLPMIERRSGPPGRGSSSSRALFPRLRSTLSSSSSSRRPVFTRLSRRLRASSRRSFLLLGDSHCCGTKKPSDANATEVPLLHSGASFFSCSPPPPPQSLRPSCASSSASCGRETQRVKQNPSSPPPPLSPFPFETMNSSHSVPTKDEEPTACDKREARQPRLRPPPRADGLPFNEEEEAGGGGGRGDRADEKAPRGQGEVGEEANEEEKKAEKSALFGNDREEERRRKRSSSRGEKGGGGGGGVFSRRSSTSSSSLYGNNSITSTAPTSACHTLRESLRHSLEGQVNNNETDQSSRREEKDGKEEKEGSSRLPQEGSELGKKKKKGEAAEEGRDEEEEEEQSRGGSEDDEGDQKREDDGGREEEEEKKKKEEEEESTEATLRFHPEEKSLGRKPASANSQRDEEEKEGARTMRVRGRSLSIDHSEAPSPCLPAPSPVDSRKGKRACQDAWRGNRQHSSAREDLGAEEENKGEEKKEKPREGEDENAARRRERVEERREDKKETKTGRMADAEFLHGEDGRERSSGCCGDGRLFGFVEKKEEERKEEEEQKDQEEEEDQSHKSREEEEEEEDKESEGGGVDLPQPLRHPFESPTDESADNTEDLAGRNQEGEEEEERERGGRPTADARVKTEEHLVGLQRQISVLGVSLYEVRREQAFARQLLAALCGSVERALSHASYLSPSSPPLPGPAPRASSSSSCQPGRTNARAALATTRWKGVEGRGGEEKEKRRTRRRRRKRSDGSRYHVDTRREEERGLEGGRGRVGRGGGGEEEEEEDLQGSRQTGTTMAALLSRDDKGEAENRAKEEEEEEGRSRLRIGQPEDERGEEFQSAGCEAATRGDAECRGNREDEREEAREKKDGDVECRQFEKEEGDAEQRRMSELRELNETLYEGRKQEEEDEDLSSLSIQGRGDGKRVLVYKMYDTSDDLEGRHSSSYSEPSSSSSSSSSSSIPPIT